MTLILVALSMLLKDAVGTIMVVAEARGRAILAGTLDAMGDLANVLCTVFGAGEIVLHGWGWAAVEILAVMMATSFVATSLSVRWGRRLTAHKEIAP